MEKVLKRYSAYQSDSLKYLAAVFLIENMPDYSYYEGESISNYRDYFKMLNSRKSEPHIILDSLNRVYGGFDLKSNKRKLDIETIDSAYLCENIELAFQSWQKYPWTAHYSFDEFCEYILPYRIGNELLTRWRAIFLEKYSSIVDNVESSNPIVVAKLLRDSLINRLGHPRFTLTRPAGYPTLDALSSQQMSGTCDDLTQFTISLFRTFGIACSVDIIPMRGDANVGHSWVSLVDSEGELYNSDFFGEILYVSEFMTNRSSLKTKVFRKTFSKNQNEVLKFSENNVEIPRQLCNYVNRSIDVTKFYANNLIDLHISRGSLYENRPHPAMAFLCAPSWLEWRPIAWSEFNEDGGITFNDVDGGSVLRIAYFNGAEIEFLSSPFYIHKQSRDLVFIPDADFSKVKDVTLYSKFSVIRDLHFVSRLVNGRFEGSNDPKFTNTDTLHIIKEVPDRLFTEVLLDSPRKYRYLRYKGSEGSHCNIAEIEFFSDTAKLNGEIIGTAGAWENNTNYEFTSAFDGRTETSFDHSTTGEGWTGLSLAQAKNVTKIRYAPRNFDNYIKIDHDYELFVSTKEGWKSLGKQKSESDSLMYQDVPLNALLYLRNYSGGVEERIFNIENGQQVFR
ncbi:hypothetical protein [Parapedobacter sp. 10938]|uniref:hypothetical protein n=1 Tax=Parapedobacter flavus TaxID=3110225 RepID=UPI002DB90AD2|nr:hypothetical protein [Parapedobacter sp. 10938]MEC3881791.1 hypothetical protein [Parapedobacter sp. 10938]